MKFPAWVSSSLTASAVVMVFAASVGAQSSAPVGKSETGQKAGSQNVEYVAGGVGLDAREQMQNRANSYNVRLMFAESGGEFLVPESVSVSRGNIDVLRVADAGPLLFMNLPNGTYTVNASYKGMVRSKAIQVAGRTPDVVLTWPTERQ